MNTHPSHTHITIDMSMNSSTELSNNVETIEYLRGAQESDHDTSPRETNSDTSFVSYYEEGDSFKPHFDVFQFTALIWLYKEPKQ